MSGIAGVQDRDDSARVGGMLDALGHRGPDGRDVETGEWGSCGAVHLQVGPRSVPAMTSASGITVLFDGEIYNFAELQESLPDRALCESELVLKLYRREGTAFLERINGPFALAICEGSDIMLARDRVGLAPLYWGMREGRLCFASEMKALIRATDDIHVLPPGHFFKREARCFAARTDVPTLEAEPEVIASALRKRLEKAVARRLDGDGPFGIWLSGGLDSASLAAIAAQMKRPLYTFAAGVAGAPDLKFARQTADHLGTKHFEVHYTVDDMLQALPRVVFHLESFDALLVRSSIANYLVAWLASRHTRVVLSGEGGDELFAGYHFFKDLPESGLPAALADAQAALAGTALMRVDRMAAAHGTRARPCFLDPDVIAYANAVPTRYKIWGEKKVEKWILRQALQGSLPDEVRLRPKEKFWSGSGVGDSISRIADARIGDDEFQREREIGPGFILPSKEDLFYFRIFKEHFPATQAITTTGMTRQRDWH